ncbi:MAG: SPOR domain-containing protein, partial [Campylobacter sp.]|nr:SPOR domain-containing protein [Campylobacter sp.]
QIVINEPKKEQIIINEPKVEPKKVEPKVEPKKVEPKKEQPKVEQPKKQEPKTQKGGSPKDVSSLSSGTYVQVYALSQYSSTSPSVKKIAEKGYTPLAYKSGNITRILVGPFTTNDELNKALSQMRTLSKDAFVHRVK